MSDKSQAFLRPREREAVAPFKFVAETELTPKVKAALERVDPGCLTRRSSAGKPLKILTKGKKSSARWGRVYVREYDDAFQLTMMTDLEFENNPNQMVGHVPLET